MRLPILLAALAAAGTLATAASADSSRSECRRFEAAAQPTELQPRLGRLCVRLIDAHDSADGLTVEEREAATRLGQYLAVIGELEIRRGAIGLNGAPGRGATTTETARYLIAHRLGLLDIADRLAPLDRQAALAQ